jgi:RING finger protein 113A
MFKKRVVKTGNEAKRKLDHDVDSGSDAEITHNNDEINLKRTKYRRHEVSNSNGGKNIMVATAAQEVRDDDNDKTKPEPETVVKPKLVGPKPVAANIRTTTITDFQPDVCKDFFKKRVLWVRRYVQVLTYTRGAEAEETFRERLGSGQ